MNLICVHRFRHCVCRRCALFYETDVTEEVVGVDHPPLCLRPSEVQNGLDGELPWIFSV